MAQQQNNQNQSNHDDETDSGFRSRLNSSATTAHSCSPPSTSSAISSDGGGGSPSQQQQHNIQQQDLTRNKESNYYQNSKTFRSKSFEIQNFSHKHQNLSSNLNYYSSYVDETDELYLNSSCWGMNGIHRNTFSAKEEVIACQTVSLSFPTWHCNKS